MCYCARDLLRVVCGRKKKEAFFFLLLLLRLSGLFSADVLQVAFEVKKKKQKELFHRVNSEPDGNLQLKEMALTRAGVEFNLQIVLR